MTPLDFVTQLVEEGEPPTVNVLATEHIKISSSKHDWEVLSYYYDDVNGCMCLDIRKKKDR